MSSIIPFTFTFAEYIRHCAMNSKRLREKIFEQEIRNKMVVEWYGIVKNIYGTNVDLYIHNTFGHSSANVIVNFADDVKKTYKEEFVREKGIWFRAKINIVGGPGQKHQLIAVPMDKNNQPDLAMTFTVFLETYASILDGFDKQIFPLWKGKKLSFIGTVETFEELTEDPYYCAILRVIISEPLHDNEMEPVKVLIQTSNLHLIPQIKDNPQAAMEFEAIVHERDQNHHFFLLDEILQILNNKYKQTRRRNPAVPSSYTPSLQIDGNIQQMTKEQGKQGQEKDKNKHWDTLRVDLYNPHMHQHVLPNQFNMPNIPNMPNAYNPYAIQVPPQALINAFQMNSPDQNRIQLNPKGVTQPLYPIQPNMNMAINPLIPQNQNQYQQMNQQMAQMNVYGTFYPGYAQIPTGIQPVVIQNEKIPLMTQQQEEAKGFCCSLTSKIMLDPVKDSQGHVFNRADIESFLKDMEICPLTQHTLTINQLIPMPELKKTIEKYLNDNPERQPR